MSPSPVSSFTRNLIGFAIFLSVSFGVTFAVNTITAQQSEEEMVAAAAAELLKPAQQ